MKICRPSVGWFSNVAESEQEQAKPDDRVRDVYACARTAGLYRGRVRSWIIMRRAITHYAPPYLATRNALLSEWVRQYAGELDYGCIRGNALSFYNARVSFVFSPFVPLSLSLSLSFTCFTLTEIKRSNWPWDSFATNTPVSYRFDEVCVCSGRASIVPCRFIPRRFVFPLFLSFPVGSRTPFLSPFPFPFPYSVADILFRDYQMYSKLGTPSLKRDLIFENSRESLQRESSRGERTW